MVLTPAKARLLIGLWVLLGLIVLAYNAMVLTTLYDRPLSGLSRDVRAAMRKTREFEQIMAARSPAVLDQSRLDVVLQKGNPISARVYRQKPKPPEKKKIQPEPVEPKPETITLPRLYGIISGLDDDGNLRLAAMMEGIVLSKKDTIRGFRVSRITEKGVVLSRGEQTWFVPAPKVYFSIQQEN